MMRTRNRFIRPDRTVARLSHELVFCQANAEYLDHLATKYRAPLAALYAREERAIIGHIECRLRLARIQAAASSLLRSFWEAAR